jgi:hypothetical protein
LPQALPQALQLSNQQLDQLGQLELRYITAKDEVLEAIKQETERRGRFAISNAVGRGEIVIS